MSREWRSTDSQKGGRMKKVSILCGTLLLLTQIVFAGGKSTVLAPKEAPVAPIVKSEVNPLYVGGGATFISINSYLYGKDSIAGLHAMIGYNIAEYLAVEYRGVKGLSTGDQLSHDFSYGLYVKPQYMLNDTWGIYALAGYGQSKITFDNEKAFNGVTQNRTKQSGFGYGAGLSYTLDEKWSLYLDAMRYIDKSTTKEDGKYAIKVDGLSFGVLYHF